MLKDLIEQDLKRALLSKDKLATDTLRGLKSAILYTEVAQGKKDNGLNDQEITEVISKEAKKRQESASLYSQGGEQERADTELKEKLILEKYLPKQLSEDEIIKIIDQEIDKSQINNLKDMGRVIGAVKSTTAGSADGAVIARLVKERLS